MGDYHCEDDENMFWTNGRWKFEVFLEGSLNLLMMENLFHDDLDFAFLKECRF